MDLTRYNKLIASVAGAIVSFALAWLAMKTPLVECALVDTRQVCSVFGMSEGEVTGLLVGIITSLSVAVGPKNSMTNVETVQAAESLKAVKSINLDSAVSGSQEINAATGVKVSAS